MRHGLLIQAAGRQFNSERKGGSDELLCDTRLPSGDPTKTTEDQGRIPDQTGVLAEVLGEVVWAISPTITISANRPIENIPLLKTHDRLRFRKMLSIDTRRILAKAQNRGGYNRLLDRAFKVTPRASISRFYASDFST